MRTGFFSYDFITYAIMIKLCIRYSLWVVLLYLVGSGIDLVAAGIVSNVYYVVQKILFGMVLYLAMREEARGTDVREGKGRWLVDFMGVAVVIGLFGGFMLAIVTFVDNEFWHTARYSEVIAKQMARLQSDNKYTPARLSQIRSILSAAMPLAMALFSLLGTIFWSAILGLVTAFIVHKTERGLAHRSSEQPALPSQ